MVSGVDVDIDGEMFDRVTLADQHLYLSIGSEKELVPFRHHRLSNISTEC